MTLEDELPRLEGVKDAAVESRGNYGHESKQTPGDSGGQRSLACYSPGDHRVGHDLVN